MGKYRRLFMASIVGLTFQKLQAQEQYAILEKNVNIRAKGLVHQLNKTKDTLILSSDKKINKVYSISETNVREINTYINKNTFKVPLNKLSKGKHVFVVVQSPLRIVFVVKVLQEGPVVLPVSEIKLSALKNED